jgi:hypothetical protein
MDVKAVIMLEFVQLFSVIFCSCYEANTFIGLFKTVAGKEILLWPHEA